MNMSLFRKHKPAVITAVTALFLLAAAFLLDVYVFKDGKGRVAVIKQDRKILYEIELDKTDSQQEIIITGEHSITNTVLVKNGEIGVTHATCPDKVCVNTGFISNGEIPIVCLPNRLEITITSNTQRTDGVAG